MKRFTKMKLVMLAGVITILTACTPEQLRTLERVTGFKPTPALRSELLELPDAPIGVTDGEIMPDGSIRPWQAPAGSNCPQWYGVARQAGWPESDWARLDHVMYRESRCDPTVHAHIGKGYVFRNDDSRGLVQVNVKEGIGTRPFIGPLVNWNFDALWDPYTNLWVGRRMYELWSSKPWSHYCGWWGWSTKGSDWC